MRRTQKALLAATLASIFVIDTVMHLEIAVAMFYAPAIAQASGTLQRKGLLALGGLCGALTLASFALTPAGLWQEGIINTAFSLLALALTLWQVLRLQAARASAHAAQAQWLRMARARQLEGLASSLAHEINQPLAALVTSADSGLRWLAHQPPELERVRQSLARIRQNAERASHIITRMRNLTQGKPVQRSAFALHEALGEVLELSQAEMQRLCIHCHSHFAPELPPAWADRIQVQQVMACLLLNAMEAVSTLPAAQPRHIHIQTMQQDDTLIVGIHDSGPGVAPQAQAHLFDAFWSSKESGMGVGLAISRTLIQANGGQIWLQPGTSGGAHFQFSVPKHHEKPQP